MSRFLNWLARLYFTYDRHLNPQTRGIQKCHTFNRVTSKLLLRKEVLVGNAPNSYSFNLVFWSTIKKLLLFQPRILQFTLNLSPKDVGFYGFRLEEPFCFITQKRLERSSLATGISFKFFNAFILDKNVDNKKLIY